MILNNLFQAAFTQRSLLSGNDPSQEQRELMFRAMDKTRVSLRARYEIQDVTGTDGDGTR
jgi:hypothetical protein